jgi:hypothetical protein
MLMLAQPELKNIELRYADDSKGDTHISVDQESPNESPSRSASFSKSGYVNYSGISLLPGENSTAVRFQVINAYRFSEKFSAGLGVGYIPYNDPLGLLPIFLEARYQFLESNISPFVFFRTGYGISVLADKDLQVDNHVGGLVLNPGIGVVFHTNGAIGWSFTAGLNIDHAAFDQQRWAGQTVRTKLVYQRLQVGVALSF